MSQWGWWQQVSVLQNTHFELLTQKVSEPIIWLTKRYLCAFLYIFGIFLVTGTVGIKKSCIVDMIIMAQCVYVVNAIEHAMAIYLQDKHTENIYIMLFRVTFFFNGLSLANDNNPLLLWEYLIYFNPFVSQKEWQCVWVPTLFLASAYS